MPPRIFVSHSSADTEVVESVVKLLEAAFVVAPGDIRCTSLPGYRFSGGDRASDRIRAEIASAEALLAIITRESFASAWVLIELGARWGHNRSFLSLLGPGVEPDVLRGPTREYIALSCAVAADLEQALNDLSVQSGLPKRPRDEYEAAFRTVLALKDPLIARQQEATSPENERRVLKVLQDHPDVYLQPGAGIGMEVGLETEVARTIAERLVNKGQAEWRLDQFGRQYRLSRAEKARLGLDNADPNPDSLGA